jgi:ABC-type multidrug transport system fused ATPase/permease subunit
LTIEYQAGAPVLKNVTASIKPREKIGIVGRTGAGKSTLVTALFRMVEPANGTIEIDGVDIRELGLADLRSRLAIIPQLPQLFIGTIRYNIDPFGEASDERIWRSLEMVQLKDFVASLDGQLDAKVEENGSNFSQGMFLISMNRGSTSRSANVAPFLFPNRSKTAHCYGPCASPGRQGPLT